MLRHIADKSGRSHSVEDAFLGEHVAARQVIEHGRQHSARAAGGRCGNDTTRSVLLAHGQRIGKHHASALQVGLVARCFHVVSGCLASQSERSGQHSFVVEATFNGSLHHLPHLAQIVPDVAILAFLHVFPVASAVAFAPFLNLTECLHLVNLVASVAQRVVFALRKGTSAHAEHRPRVARTPFFVDGFEQHAVGMEGQSFPCIPYNVDGTHA